MDPGRPPRLVDQDGAVGNEEMIERRATPLPTTRASSTIRPADEELAKAAST